MAGNKSTHNAQEHPSTSPFDFDGWSELARTDPERFEGCRREVVQAFIDHSPPEYRPRLEGLQFQVDMTRRRARNPLDACQRVYALAMKHFHGMFVPAVCQGRFPKAGHSAKVLDLGNRKRPPKE